MDVLVLGGTSFVGRTIVEDLVARGHTPTLFTRGVTNPDLFPELPRRSGDRATGDYEALGEGAWDAVVDVSGYVPRHVNQALDALDTRTGRYLFVSTGSVYSREDAAATGMTEDTRRLAPYRDDEEITGETYGRLKVACEDDLTARLGDRLTLVRPGIVAGPHDSTDRFTYWVRRAARGGTAVLPGRPDQPVQVVDSRDLARLVTTLLEQDVPGTFNAVGPATPVTMAELIATCAQAAGTALDLIAVDPALGGDHFPLVLDDPSWDPMFRRSAAAAHAVGMPQTPLLQTAQDVLAWDRTRGLPPLVAGWTEDEEAAALAAKSGA
jgi:2'-hydroxyisoflavone reductase